MQKTISRILSLLLVLTLIFTLGACKKDDKKDDKKPEKQTTKVSYINPLTGENNLSKALRNKRPVAAMVENSPAARPQWGLGSPDITVEALVEGGITRMLWIYANPNKMPKIGPTRSARIDFLEMAEGLDAIYIHFGGAASAYDALYARGYDDIDGAGRGNLGGTASYFDRDSSRRGRGIEHTAYTKGEWMAKAIKDTGVRYDVKEAYAKPFEFNSKKTKLKDGDCAEITCMFSSGYKHTFKYDSEKKVYLNHMNTKPMVDENGKQMAVSNVILLYFPSYRPIPNTKGSIDMDLSGGKGVIASNGTYQNITWRKGGPNDMLKLMDEQGNTLKLNKGKSYIGLIPSKNASATVIK